MTTTKTIGIVFVAGLPLFLLLLIASFRLFDELLRVQFSDVHSEWERCDSPSGYFWKPPGSRHLSLRRRGDLWSHWYWNRPQWIDCSERSRTLYRRFKLMGQLSIVAFAPVFGAGCCLVMIALDRTLAFVAGHVQ